VVREALVCFLDQLLVKALSLPPDLRPATRTIAERQGSQANATRHSPRVNDFVHCLERQMDTGSQAMPCHEARWN